LLWRRETEGQEYDSPERRAALDARLRTALGKIGDPGLRAHYGQAIKERRAKLFAPPPSVGAGRSYGGGHQGAARGGRRPGAWAPQGLPSASLKSSQLARAAGFEAEARGREAVLLLTLLNHPHLAARKLDLIDDLEFVCRDLETLKRALISCLDSRDATADRSVMLEEIERSYGEPPLTVLLGSPQARQARFADAEAGDDIAEHGFEETLGRHRALLSQAREVAEAEIELAEGAGEDLDRRLEAVTSRRFREAAPSPPDEDEDESQLSAKLKRLVDAEIWVKRNRGRS
ncbi:MAG: hypothetical protein AAFU55_12970, partial [Pseudomonadota bacterium]